MLLRATSTSSASPPAWRRSFLIDERVRAVVDEPPTTGCPRAEHPAGAACARRRYRPRRLCRCGRRPRAPVPRIHRGAGRPVCSSIPATTTLTGETRGRWREPSGDVAEAATCCRIPAWPGAPGAGGCALSAFPAEPQWSPGEFTWEVRAAARLWRRRRLGRNGAQASSPGRRWRSRSRRV